MASPAKHYINNVSNTLRPPNIMVEHGAGSFIFSSSVAVYANVPSDPIKESHPRAPINPYGRTKRIVEQTLEDFSAAHRLNFFALRYFNEGADPQARIGERNNPEIHLIPLVLQAASGRREAITVFGTRLSNAGRHLYKGLCALDDLVRGACPGTPRVASGTRRRLLQSWQRARIQRSLGAWRCAASSRAHYWGKGCGQARERSAGPRCRCEPRAEQTWVGAETG